VTGHRYKLNWGIYGLDWEQIQISISERWQEDDKPVNLVFNFTDVRSAMEVDVNGEIMPQNYMA